MLWIWAVLSLVLAGSQEADSISEGSKLRRNVRETEPNCPEGLYRGGQFCCQPCQPGERKYLDCTTNGDKPRCFPCKEGKEYMDKENYSDKCRRCAFCDGEHGLEVETNCTQTQNTKCKCKSNFYCNAPVCEHCDPCVSCEHGILERCTSTSNTKCKQERSRNHLLWLFIIPGLAILLVAFVYIKHRREHHVDPESGTANSEDMPMNLPDVDLRQYILNIAEEMSLDQVKTFVRKNGMSEVMIDEIKNDNLQHTAEQKIQLLQWWYQAHGRKDAYRTLIKGLRRMKRYALADRIQAIIQADIENTNADTRNENE
ncbi:tumor necrosis factor receptor superfamily member 6 [Arvicola amphibius]|uniref:tumor necrosis factor receptor superfamily member 6 n=1 Tax=Arvicola amphibius TaxID=1047088 RepID=UPI0018E3223A|nr:tumor necrosis factor receptor superfamily member 6 [Arvicola amphibius]